MTDRKRIDQMFIPASSATSSPRRRFGSAIAALPGLPAEVGVVTRALQITATAAGKTSAPAQLSFTITP